MARLVALASGAALLNVRTALADLGTEPRVTTWPDGPEGEVLAAIRPGDSQIAPSAPGGTDPSVDPPAADWSSSPRREPCHKC